MEIIGIDFDGTLAEYAEGWEGWSVVGEPLPGAIPFLKALSKAGYRIGIFSARARDPKGKAAIENWLVKHDVNDIVDFVTSEKLPNFSIFVDDRAVRFDDNYREILKFILKRKG